MSIRFTLLSAKNATDWLSGDQNGKRAPSVPGSTRGDTVLSGRSHKRDWPSDVAANVSVWPSGESANDAGSAGRRCGDLDVHFAKGRRRRDRNAGATAHSRQQRLRAARRLSARRYVRSDAMQVRPQGRRRVARRGRRRARVARPAMSASRRLPIFLQAPTAVAAESAAA